MNKDQQIANLKYALEVMWPKVDPATVLLTEWRCGTYACFGGHVAVDPYFKALGVWPGHVGAPYMDLGPDQIGPERVGKRLFDDEDIFRSRFFHPADPHRESGMPDHEIVRRRLEHALWKIQQPPNDWTPD